MTIQEIRDQLKGYHIEITLYPSGGMIEATGCFECGTDDSKCEAVSWKTHKGQDEKFAVDKLKLKLGIKL